MAEEVKAPAPELERAEIPWVVAYLREDIQDLRNEVRMLTIESYEKRDGKIDAGTDGLDARIEGLRSEMDVQFRWIIGIVIGAMLAMTGVFAWIVDRMLAS